MSGQVPEAASDAAAGAAAGRSLQGRGWRFVATGVMVNGALFGVLWLLLRLGIGYLVAMTVVYVLGMAWGYLQNRIWSWQSRAPVAQSFLTYLTVYAGVYVAHVGCVTALVEWVGVPPLAAVMLSVGLLILPVFLALDRLVFRGRAS